MNTYDPFGQRVKIERNDTAATVIYTPFKELMRIVLFSFILLLFILPLVSASSQSLIYDNPTNELNMSYDSLNRILNKSSATENITYTYDDEYYGTLTNVTIDEDSYEYEYDDRLRVTKEIRTY